MGCQACKEAWVHLLDWGMADVSPAAAGWPPSPLLVQPPLCHCSQTRSPQPWLHTGVPSMYSQRSIGCSQLWQEGRTVTLASKLRGLCIFMASYCFKKVTFSGKCWHVVIFIHLSVARGTIVCWNADFIHGTCFFFLSSLLDEFIVQHYV